MATVWVVGCYDDRPNSKEPFDPIDASAAVSGRSGADLPSVPMKPTNEAGAGGSNPSECKLKTLKEYCADRMCPINSYQARALACGSDRRWPRTEQSNDCGGVSLRFMFGLGGTIYHYDATQTLVGITQFDDTAFPPCNQLQYVYGKDCLPMQLFCPSEACMPVSCDADDAGTSDDAG